MASEVIFTVAISRSKMLNILSSNTAYIEMINSVTRILPFEVSLFEKCFMAAVSERANTAILKMLLPRMLLKQRLGFSISRVAEILVKSSGNDVIAESSTPPKKAPDNFVVLSSISIYFDALMEANTTNDTTIRYSNMSNACCHISPYCFDAITESM